MIIFCLKAYNHPVSVEVIKQVSSSQIIKPIFSSNIIKDRDVTTNFSRNALKQLARACFGCFQIVRHKR